LNIKKYKSIIITGIVILIVAVIYLQVWLQSYNQANMYYQQALKKYSAGDYISALKGEMVTTAKGNSFSGGFQQVLETWQSPYAIPKPGIVKVASAQISDIINHKLTLDAGMQAFKTYYGLDNRFLGQIVVRMGDMYAAKGDDSNAKEMYNTAMQAFPLDKNLVAECNKKIKELKNK